MPENLKTLIDMLRLKTALKRRFCNAVNEKLLRNDIDASGQGVGRKDPKVGEST